MIGTFLIAIVGYGMTVILMFMAGATLGLFLRDGSKREGEWAICALILFACLGGSGIAFAGVTRWLTGI